MKSRQLKFYLFYTLSSLISLVAQAQNLHFIYLQTDNQKPFYIKLDGQTVNSSLSGHIIIPRLNAGLHKIYIGFSQSAFPGMVANLTVNETDIGYIIKKDVDLGWYMLELLSKKIIATETQLPFIKKESIVMSDDKFANILAAVLNDSTINEIKLPVKSSQTIAAVEENKKVNTLPNPSKPAAVNTNKPIGDSNSIIKKSSVKKNKSKVAVTNFDKSDTTILIKSPEQNKKLKPKKDVALTQKKVVTPTPVPVLPLDTVNNLNTVIVKTNPKCKKTATQKDFLQLQNKMEAEKTEAGKKTIALKQFSTLCFTTGQIKNLGTLFLKEEEKYKFYVSAYAHVSDTENFKSLANQLVDNYYISRFNAMVQQ